MAFDDLGNWSSAQLGDLTDSAVDGPFGSNLKTEHYVSEPGVRVVRLQNIGRGYFNDQVRTWVSERHAATLARHDVQASDVLVASLGDENHPFARACLFPAGLSPGIVKADCFRIRLQDDLASPGFVMRVLNCDSLRNGLNGLAQGVTRDRVNLGNLLHFQLPRPPLAEQQKITEILDTLDDAIRTTEQLIAKLEKVKQGLLHDLLTRGVDENGELRDPVRHPEQFKDSVLGRIPKSWEVAELDKFLESIDAGKSPDCPDQPAARGQWGVLKVSAVHPDGFRATENKVIHNMAYVNPAYEVCEGDLLITRANTYELVGLTCRVEHAQPRLLLSDKTLRLNANEKVEPNFLLHITQMPYVRRQIETHATGSSGSMKNISQGAIRGLTIMIPHTKTERFAISTRLSTLDRRLNYERSGLGKLGVLKQGLMEDLLTGRVRVTPLLSETDP